MKKCPECDGNNAVWETFGNGICRTCAGRRFVRASVKSRQQGRIGTIEETTVETCPDCYGTSVCQYCMGFGFIP